MIWFDFLWFQLVSQRVDIDVRMFSIIFLWYWNFGIEWYWCCNVFCLSYWNHFLLKPSNPLAFYLTFSLKNILTCYLTSSNHIQKLHTKCTHFFHLPSINSTFLIFPLRSPCPARRAPQRGPAGFDGFESRSSKGDHNGANTMKNGRFMLGKWEKTFV